MIKINNLEIGKGNQGEILHYHPFTITICLEKQLDTKDFSFKNALRDIRKIAASISFFNKISKNI